MAEAAARSQIDLLLEGIWKRNPVFVHLLGMCPLLAVSNSAVNSLSMALATSFVLVMSSLSVSLIRRVVPAQIRIATFIVVIATFVTVAERLLQAVSLDIHRSLGAYVPLIVVNCIILGRAEAFASKHPPIPAVLDALGTAAGFTLAIVAMGAVRELLGSGALFGVALFGPRFQPWVIMVLPSGGFFVLAALLMAVALIDRARARGAEEGQAAVETIDAAAGTR